MSDVVELVSAIASQLLRDPRVHPRRGDVVDDDPPLVPLTVVDVWPNEEAPRMIEAERRAHCFGHPVIHGRWKGTLSQWVAETRP